MEASYIWVESLLAGSALLQLEVVECVAVVFADVRDGVGAGALDVAVSD